mmetsp:Transcript_98075/g.299818  ORF Transcript_98075/g.299818 Transcript_98075/m.299818 type:complete len:237 (-) Transcript_98075:368-1078(-)
MQKLRTTSLPNHSFRHVSNNLKRSCSISSNALARLRSSCLVSHADLRSWSAWSSASLRVELLFCRSSSNKARNSNLLSFACAVASSRAAMFRAGMLGWPFRAFNFARWNSWSFASNSRRSTGSLNSARRADTLCAFPKLSGSPMDMGFTQANNLHSQAPAAASSVTYKSLQRELVSPSDKFLYTNWPPFAWKSWSRALGRSQFVEPHTAGMSPRVLETETVTATGLSGSGTLKFCG